MKTGEEAGPSSSTRSMVVTDRDQVSDPAEDELIIDDGVQ